MVFENAWGAPVNYEPSSDPDRFKEHRCYLCFCRELRGSHEQASISRTLITREAGENFRSLDEMQQKNLVKILASDLKLVRSVRFKKNVCAVYYKTEEMYSEMTSETVDCDIKIVANKDAELTK